MEILAGFVFGLLGSLHCLGMCGPLAVAIPHSKGSRWTEIADGLLYNFGRILTYTILGVVVGLFGSAISLSKYQNTISIVVGILLLLYVVLPGKMKVHIAKYQVFQKVSIGFKSVFHKALQSHGKISLLVIGLLNGLLPCGLVYVALATSAVFADGLKSGAYMLLFGLGTAPMIFSVFFFRKIITLDIRRKMLKLIPVGIAVIACLLILRGMSLGIPYVSPVLPDKIVKEADCCH